MKKILLLNVLILIVSIPTFAGGILTNTNQHAAFLRMMSRGASIGIDGVYYNPAGTAFMKDGFYMSLNGQSAFQTRTIDSKFKLGQKDLSHFYKGEASAPFLPSLFGVYKNDKWAFSGSFGVVGGGGKASFGEGLPIFNNSINALIASKAIELAKIGKTIPPYSISSSLDGKQIIFGLQFGVAYQFNDWLSGYAGGRMNYFIGGYEGYLDAAVIPARAASAGSLVSMDLDVSQSGWGLTPIIGLDAKLGRLNIGLKYEFMTNMNIENKTKTNEFMVMGQKVPVEKSPLKAYKDGVNTPSDIPAILTAAAQYSILPTLRASAEWHYYFDKQAGMADNKQKALSRGTIEYAAGVEWDVLKRVTLSAGIQDTDYGQTDNFQVDTSFSCDSYSIGLGAEFKLNSHMNVNIGYMWTNYKDYKMKATVAPGLSSDNTYGRTNKVFGLGVDYKF